MSKKASSRNEKTSTTITNSHKRTTFKSTNIRNSETLPFFASDESLYRHISCPKASLTTQMIGKNCLLKSEKCGTEDLVENEENSARPEVLSIDSDFSSGNGMIDSPDQETVTDMGLLLNKIRPTKSTRLQTDLSHHKSFGISNVKFASTEQSYCTPARTSDGDKEKRSGKKGTTVEQKKPFSQIASPNVVPGLVTTDHNEETRMVYGRMRDNNPEQFSSNTYAQIDSDYFSNQNLADKQKGVEISKALVNQCSEEMDMKFTDITHMQLKKSLDLIHGMSSSRSTKSSTSLSNYVQNPPYSNGYYSNSVVSSPLVPVSGVFSSISGPLVSSCPVSTCNHLGLSTSAPQSNFQLPVSSRSGLGTSELHSTKFDAVLHVKDAMLQEKESVILKLRLQIASLQHQIQEGDAALRQVASSRAISPKFSTVPNYSDNLSSQIEAQKKIHELEQLLGKAECHLSQKSSQFDKEHTDVKNKIEKLTAALKSKDKTNSELKKKQKSAVERLEKYKKRVECLERYLADLPTIEENDKLKTEAGMLGEERENLVVQISTLKTKMEEKVKLIANKEYDIERLKVREQEQTAKIISLEEELKKSEKSKTDLGSNERDELEDMKFEINRLRKEKEDAALMVSGCEKRNKQLQEKHAKEISSMQEKLQDAEDLCENLRRDLFLKQQTANKVHTAMKNLSAQNQELLDQKLNLQDRVKDLEKLHSTMQESSRACLRLQRETNEAVLDVKAVTQVLIQTAQGTDPNISALLGVRSDSIDAEEGLLCQSEDADDKSDGSQIETRLSVEFTNKRLTEIRQLRKEIDQLRTMLSNQYAESIGDNCTTQ